MAIHVHTFLHCVHRILQMLVYVLEGAIIWYNPGREGGSPYIRGVLPPNIAFKSLFKWGSLRAMLCRSRRRRFTTDCKRPPQEHTHHELACPPHTFCSTKSTEMCWSSTAFSRAKMKGKGGEVACSLLHKLTPQCHIKHNHSGDIVNEFLFYNKYMSPHTVHESWSKGESASPVRHTHTCKASMLKARGFTTSMVSAIN